MLINDELDDLFEEKEYNPVTQRHILFFVANLAIARFDHALTPSDGDFSRLFSFSRDLLRSSRYRGNKFAILLQSKCKYLICKWLVRKTLVKGPMYAVVNSVEKEFTIIDYKEKLFSEWIDYLENHYELIRNWKAHLSQHISAFRNKPLNDLSLYQLHSLTKFHKDVQPNLTQLSAIKDEVDLRYNKVKNNGDEYDIFVYGIALNYIAGNHFSLLRDQDNITEETVARGYQAIVDIQASTGVNNFFPQYKYVEYLIRKLRAYPKSLNMFQDLEIQRKYIDTCKSVFDTYAKHIEWSRKNYNYIFHLPAAESKVNTDNNQLKELFIASSFVVPLYKQEYIDAFEKFKKEVDAFDAGIIISENIQNELGKIATAEKKINQLKIDLENREIKSIETLSIFTSIVTFVFASVVEFKFISTSSQAVLFTLCLSTSLGMFVFLILIVLLRSNSFISTVRRYFWRILMALLLICGLWFLIVYAPIMKDFIRKSQTVNVKINEANKRTGTVMKVVIKKSDSTAKK